MLKVKMLKIIVILLISQQISAIDFIVVADEQSFFNPCESTDNRGNVKVSDYADINIRNEYAEDQETLVSNGNITFKEDIPDNTPIQLYAEILVWKRGKWEDTIFSIRRPDFCKDFLNPYEPWHKLVMQVPEKYRTCPPKKNMVYEIENMENRISIPNINGIDLEGQYKIIVHFKAGKYAICLNTIANVWIE